MIKKIILLSFILTVAQLTVAQQLIFSPIIGLKADITRIPFYVRHLEIPDYRTIDEHTYWLTANPKPVFGFRMEYQIKRSNFSVGLIMNDGANSRYTYSFLAVENGENVLIKRNVYNGAKVTKVPLTYNYEWFHSATGKFSFNFNLGCNLAFIKKSNEPYHLLDSETFTLAEGLSAGEEITLNTYLIDAAVFSKSALRVTFDLGVSLKLKLNSRMYITTSFYFEKGIKKWGMSALETEFKINNGTVYRQGNGSSGSAFHFKVMVPILVKDYEKQ